MMILKSALLQLLVPLFVIITLSSSSFFSSSSTVVVMAQQQRQQQQFQHQQFQHQQQQQQQPVMMIHKNNDNNQDYDSYDSSSYYTEIVSFISSSRGKNKRRNSSSSSSQKNRFLQTIQVGGFVDTDGCSAHLLEADKNNDGYVDRNEYPEFAKVESPDGLLDDVVDFSHLPTPYTLAFITAACLCNNPDYGGDELNDDCCVGDNAKIAVPDGGASSTGGGNDDYDAYLYATCVLTSAAAEAVVNSPQPSGSPSFSPTGSAIPTIQPSIVPTNVNTTQEPVVVRVNANVDYSIAIRDGKTIVQDDILMSELTSNLILAMDRLAQSIADKSFNTLRRKLINNNNNNKNHKNQQQQPMLFLRKTTTRILQGITKVELPTDIMNRKEITCPKGGLQHSNSDVDKDDEPEIMLETSDSCQQYTAVVKLAFEYISADDINQNNEKDVLAKFENDLYNAIYDGDYQSEINEIYNDNDNGETTNPIIVLTGLIAPSSSNNIVEIPTENLPPEVAKSSSGGKSLSPGAISAITIGAILAALVPLAIFISNRNKEHGDSNKKKEYKEYRPDEDDDLQLGGSGDGRGGGGGDDGSRPPLRLPDISATGSVHTDFAVKSTGDSGHGAGVLGAAALGAAQQTDYGNGRSGSSKKAMETMMFDSVGGIDDFVAEPGCMIPPDSGHNIITTHGDDASSNAGSSGWSSSAGISSLNTGSIDDSSDIAAAAGATLAGIGLASGTFRQTQHQQQHRGGRRPNQNQDQKTTSSIPTSSDFDTSGDDDYDDDDQDRKMKSGDGSEPPAVTRDHLDALIESGDWAAVGATAALLAAASDSQSATTGQSRASGSHGSASVDAVRTAELDQLVDSGDWEGVVKAAAKFEEAEKAASASRGDSHSRAHSSAESTGSGTGTGTFTGTYDPSVSTSVSDDIGRAAKLAEYRSEVEALVRRVVPEEIDNVDEMMKQFRGREEELIETLRTMQERAVVQKARQAKQKSAKLEAKRSVQRGVAPGSAGFVAQRVANLETSAPGPSTSARSLGTGTAPLGGSAKREPVVVETVLDDSDRSLPRQRQQQQQQPTQQNPFDFIPQQHQTQEQQQNPFNFMQPTTQQQLPTQQQNPFNFFGTFTGEATQQVRQTENPFDVLIHPSPDDIAMSDPAFSNARSQLDAAIEAGDWMAVGQAAALLSTESVTTVSSGEIKRLANTTSSLGSSNHSSGLQGINAARAAELDDMIDKGDWNAVVAVSKRFSQEDKMKSSGSGTSGPSRISKEEEEALREAELWMKIAEQKKAEAGGAVSDAAASDAAEWAIHRSLSQLREAELKSMSQQQQQQQQQHHPPTKGGSKGGQDHDGEEV